MESLDKEINLFLTCPKLMLTDKVDCPVLQNVSPDIISICNCARRQVLLNFVSRVTRILISCKIPRRDVVPSLFRLKLILNDSVLTAGIISVIIIVSLSLFLTLVNRCEKFIHGTLNPSWISPKFCQMIYLSGISVPILCLLTKLNAA